MHARRISEKAPRIEDIVDLPRFPFHLPNDRITKSLIAECQSSLQSEGVYLLRGLLRPAAIEQMIDEANRVSHLAYGCENDHNLYLDDGDPDYPEAHIRNRRFETKIGSIASDYLGDDSLLKTLYRWDALISFIAAALGKERFALQIRSGTCLSMSASPETAISGTTMSPISASPCSYRRPDRVAISNIAPRFEATRKIISRPWIESSMEAKNAFGCSHSGREHLFSFPGITHCIALPEANPIHYAWYQSSVTAVSLKP